MAQNVVGLFDNATDAHQTLSALHAAGFGSDDINILASNARGEYNDSGEYVGDTNEKQTEAAEGAGFGATGGAVLGGLGGLIISLTGAIIPGIGPVVGAGTLIGALGSAALGAGIGAAAGSLVGALVGAGVPEQDAHIYAEGVRRGGTLIAVTTTTEDEANRATSIMEQHHVVDLDRRGEEYRSEGWQRFDETSEPHSGTTKSANTSGGTETTVVHEQNTTGTGYHNRYTMGVARPEDSAERGFGSVEQGASRVGDTAERASGADLNRDGDVGQPDPRNSL